MTPNTSICKSKQIYIRLQQRQTVTIFNALRYKQSIQIGNVSKITC